MDRKPIARCRFGGLLLAWAALWACGCQTVRTPEEQIAKSNIPIETSKVTMPPYVVEPPDILVVQVLQALPGRPIEGEFLVRPDGTISLGYYGDVFVAGLTLREVKEKIVLHLRKFMRDEPLGLVKRRVREDGTAEPRPIEPADVDTVFVDVANYNSKYYYVQGDVGLPGRLPITGNETVLDAIQAAGGLVPTAAQQNIRLVRPAPPGACCPQVLPVNLPAIVNTGDTTTNYQLMPGDRVVVFRDPIVRATVFLDRIAAPFFTVMNGIQSYSFAIRTAKSINIPIFGGTTTSTRAAATPFPPTTPASR